MKKIAVFLALAFLLTACGGERRELVDMTSVSMDGKRGIVWEDRTYKLFCVVSKSDRGEQIGYVDGDTNDRISA